MHVHCLSHMAMTASAADTRLPGAAGKTLWTTITSHIQPHLCAIGALADLLLFNILHMKLPVLQLISSGDTRWRQLHVLWQDLAASLKQLEYHELAGQLMRTMQRMPEPLCKGKVMHLLRWVPVVPIQCATSPRAAGLQHDRSSACTRVAETRALLRGIDQRTAAAAGTRRLCCWLWAAQVCL
jgi:hypothetical protein